MGKNQHSKDRMFITATEHAGLYRGYKKKTIGLTGALPFDCCALSLLPFDSPVCAREMGFYSTRCSYYRTCRRKGSHQPRVRN